MMEWREGDLFDRGSYLISKEEWRGELAGRGEEGSLYSGVVPTSFLVSYPSGDQIIPTWLRNVWWPSWSYTDTKHSPNFMSTAWDASWNAFVVSCVLISGFHCAKESERWVNCIKLFLCGQMPSWELPAQMKVSVVIRARHNIKT